MAAMGLLKQPMALSCSQKEFLSLMRARQRKKLLEVLSKARYRRFLSLEIKAEPCPLYLYISLCPAKTGSNLSRSRGYLHPTSQKYMHALIPVTHVETI